MPANDIENGEPSVWALVALPPPVTGLTLLTEKVVARLQQSGVVHCFDWSPKKLPRGWRFRLVRGWRVVRSMVKLLGAGRARNSRLYVAANSRAGLWLTLMLTDLGRRLGHEIYLHHHSYLYIDHFDRRMDRICARLGDQGVHVVACEQMERDFHRVYPTARRFAYVNPSLLTGSIGAGRTAAGAPFTLGHLSNLSHAKGIDIVLDVFRALHRADKEIRLKLAGPFYPGEARRLVTEAMAEFPRNIEWLGPVYGEEKSKFFRTIDCFVFPTRSESWGIVLNEAMSAGVPVIAPDRGCIRTVVGDRAGLLIAPNDDFASLAAAQVLRWRESRDEFQSASDAACQRAAELKQEAADILEQFVDVVFSRVVPQATAGHAAPV